MCYSSEMCETCEDGQMIDITSHSDTRARIWLCDNCGSVEVIERPKLGCGYDDIVFRGEVSYKRLDKILKRRRMRDLFV